MEGREGRGGGEGWEVGVEVGVEEEVGDDREVRLLDGEVEEGFRVGEVAVRVELEARGFEVETVEEVDELEEVVVAKELEGWVRGGRWGDTLMRISSMWERSGREG